MFILFMIFINFFITVNAKEFAKIKDLMDSVDNSFHYFNYIDIPNGKIKTNIEYETIFFTNPETYNVNVKSTFEPKTLSQKHKDFLKHWIKVKSYKNLQNNEFSSTYYIFSNQLELFYEELNITEDGKLYTFLIQKTVSDKFKTNKIKNKNINISIEFLGFHSKTKDNYFIITDYNDLGSNTKNLSENEYLQAKAAIKNNQLDFASAKITSFLGKNKNNLDAKKDLCLILYLKYLKFPSKTAADIAIKCYDLLQQHYQNAEIYYSLAFLYYQETGIKESDRKTNILLNLNKAILLLENKKNSLTEDEKIIYYNSLYLRGTFRLSIGDKSGIDDLSLVQNERSDLININLFTK